MIGKVTTPPKKLKAAPIVELLTKKLKAPAMVLVHQSLLSCCLTFFLRFPDSVHFLDDHVEYNSMQKVKIFFHSTHPLKS